MPEEVILGLKMFYSPTLGFVWIEDESNETLQIKRYTVYFSDDLFNAFILMTHGNLQELETALRQRNPELQDINDLCDFVLYSRQDGDRLAISLIKDFADCRDPILVKDVPVGSKILPNAEGVFVQVKGSGAVNEANRLVK